MPPLGFRIEKKPHGIGPGAEFQVAWVVSDAGVRRRASAEEERLWDALQAAEAELRAREEGEAAQSQREDNVPARPKRGKG